MFTSTRLKLTAWYLLIVMLISSAFSITIYKALTLELDRFEKIQRFHFERRLQERFPIPTNVHMRFIADSELIAETKGRLLFILFAINGGIFALAGVTGYFLAGRTLKPIKDMVDEQNRFISDASHELRTPLTALKSAIEVHLRDNNLTLKEAKKLLHESMRDVNKLQSLSDALLQLARYQKPSDKDYFEKLSLLSLVKEATRKVAPLAKKQKIMIRNNTKDTVVMGNKDSLVHLFVILLDNAIKYSPKQTTVTIASQVMNNNIHISVRDEGIGIAQKDLLHIFDRFFRADAARSKSTNGGYGLGLSIAKKIVSVHHGTLSVESTLNKGTTFLIQLPRRIRSR